MLIHTLKLHRRSLAATLLAVVASTAGARIVRNTIDPIAAIADAGRVSSSPVQSRAIAESAPSCA
jgi:hypothetical protein